MYTYDNTLQLSNPRASGRRAYSREPPVARGHLSFVGTAEDNKVCDGLRRLTDLLELDKEGLVGTWKHLLAYRTQHTTGEEHVLGTGISCTHLTPSRQRRAAAITTYLRRSSYVRTYVHTYTYRHNDWLHMIEPKGVVLH